jgi:predicted phosphate transport protein (TIGR00153 family)
MYINNLLNYFIPRDKKIFFPLFEQAAANLVAMAHALVETVNSDYPAEREALYQKIDQLEIVGDDITNNIYLEIGKNFLVPFDREDIHALASAIDNVADNIKGAANQMFLYKIDDFTDDIKKLSEFVLQASTDLEKAVKELKELKNIRTIADSCIRINTVENRADSVFDQAVADLFLYETDAVRIIKYKEILGSLETATDSCEDAANVMESILVKNA